MMRHGAHGPLDFHNRFTWIWSDLLARIHDPICSTNEWFGEIHRVLNNADEGQVVPVPDEMLGENRAVAPGNTVTPDPADLEMRGRHRQHVPVPFPGREPLPGVSRVFRRMRTSIHPDRSFRSLPRDVRMICNELLRVLIDFLPHAQIRRAPRGVVRRMRLALMLRQREQRRIPAVASQAGCIVDWKAEVVADFRTGNALRLIFMKPRSPFSGWINLCKRWNNSQRHH